MILFEIIYRLKGPHHIENTLLSIFAALLAYRISVLKWHRSVLNFVIANGTFRDGQIKGLLSMRLGVPNCLHVVLAGSPK